MIILHVGRDLGGGVEARVHKAVIEQRGPRRFSDLGGKLVLHGLLPGQAEGLLHIGAENWAQQHAQPAQGRRDAGISPRGQPGQPLFQQSAQPAEKAGQERRQRQRIIGVGLAADEHAQRSQQEGQKPANPLPAGLAPAKAGRNHPGADWQGTQGASAQPFPAAFQHLLRPPEQPALAAGVKE